MKRRRARLQHEKEGSITRKGGGSSRGKAANIERNREKHHVILMEDYFNESCTYDANAFRRRFRMRPVVFDRILDALVEHDEYFVQKRDAVHVLGFSSHQKITCALRFLAYGTSADQLDEYIRMAESTTLENLRHFCEGIIACFGPTYLRPPTVEDFKEILKRYEKEGWVGCMGCIDVMKWVWKNCPMAWRGAYQGKEKVPTIALEAVVDSRLYFWHAFFGVPGANNDINVLDASTLLHSLINGTAPEIKFVLHGHDYTMGYYLADGIYPEWQVMMKTISAPTTRKQKYFATKQESRRKDVERGFAALQVCCRFFLFVLCFPIFIFY